MKRLSMMTAVLAAAAVTVAVAGCGPKSRVKKGKVQSVIDQEPDKRSYVEAIGIGAADPNLPTQTQRQALSRDAAKTKAQAELLEMIKGVELVTGETVEQSIMKDQKITKRLQHVIKGAEILKTEYTSDDGAVVTLRLPKKRIERMMGIKFK